MADALQQIVLDTVAYHLPVARFEHMQGTGNPWKVHGIGDGEEGDIYQSRT
jgi:hypothetical protein